MILPGIGGSILTRPDGRPCWEPTGARLASAIIRPAELDLERAPDLVPTNSIKSFTTFGPLLHITGYEGLLEHLRRTFLDVVAHTCRPGQPVPYRANVLVVPYDFRRSIRESAQLLAEAVARASSRPPAGANGRRRVLVLAHSLGGLVARYWIGPLGGWRACHALLTLGTPHRGAPKALDWLVNGAGVGRLRHREVTWVLRGWPSMYELLPQYPAVWDEPAGRELELTELPPSHLRRYPRQAAYAPRFATMAAAARRVHEDIAAAWSEIPPDRLPAVAPYFGRGHATANLVTLDATGRLATAKADPPWRHNVGWGGDGTVPVLSAIPRELGESRASWRGERDRHGEFASTSAVLDLLKSFSGEAVPTRGAVFDGRPWLGFDLDDVVPADEELELGVIVHPEGRPAEAVQLQLSAPGWPGRRLVMSPLDGTGGRWRVVLPGLPAGRYRVLVEAQRIGGPESAFGATDLVVLDPDEESPRAAQHAAEDDAVRVAEA